jgi:ketosteroid isomerase-like protein
MYHAIVRKRIQNLFDAINHGDAEPVLSSFARNFQHCFLGDTALGGTRTTLEATRRWYQRLYRLLPDIRFELRNVSVSGSPWNTLALIEWDETNSGTDGVRTNNRGVHVARLKWGRMTQLVICPDTVGLRATLDRLAGTGASEAHATPITD